LVEAEYQLGTAAPIQLVEPRAKAADARAKLASASVSLDQFPKKVTDKKDRIEIAVTRLKKEREILDVLIRSMILVAPQDGLFVASASVGNFVRLEIR
jgi:hypothetical protein